MAGPVPYIRRSAQKYGLDPRAVMAVARGEGGLSWGAVGDQGTSFGPFQMRIGGANPYKNPRQAAAFANSPAGIDYALRKMAGAGARGLSGAQAINAIVRNFERPADPNTSVRNAIARLGQSVQDSGGMPTEMPTQGGGGGVNPALARRQFVQSMIGQIGKTPSATPLLTMLQQQAAGAGAAPSTPPETDYSGSGGGTLHDFLNTMGMGDAITSGYRPGAVTSRGTRSNHSIAGKAFDLNQNAAQFGALVNYVKSNPGRFSEFFYDPLGWYLKGGKIIRGAIGGHSDHAHIAV